VYESSFAPIGLCIYLCTGLNIERRGKKRENGAQEFKMEICELKIHLFEIKLYFTISQLSKDGRQTCKKIYSVASEPRTKTKCTEIQLIKNH